MNVTYNPNRKILITNDDSIHAEGLRILAETAKKFGRVWIVAPQEQCSAMAHRITIMKPMNLKQVEYPVQVEEAWALRGMPADCVRVGLFYIMKEKPDFVFSGMNHGPNTGFDTYYSGTVCAAMEGVMNQIPSVAFSSLSGENFAAAERMLADVMGEIIEKEEAEKGKKITALWNVNFPDCGADACRGIKWNTAVAPMQLYTDLYVSTTDDAGEPAVMENGVRVEEASVPANTDIKALFENYVSAGRIPAPVI